MEFSTEELNLARDRLYQNVIDYFLARNDLEALYVQGSIAAGTADKFSDIDFRVVINSKAYQHYISERFNAPKQWGEWIYNEWGVDLGSAFLISNLSIKLTYFTLSQKNFNLHPGFYCQQK